MLVIKNTCEGRFLFLINHFNLADGSNVLVQIAALADDVKSNNTFTWKHLPAL